MGILKRKPKSTVSVHGLSKESSAGSRQFPRGGFSHGREGVRRKFNQSQRLISMNRHDRLIMIWFDQSMRNIEIERPIDDPRIIPREAGSDR